MYSIQVQISSRLHHYLHRVSRAMSLLRAHSARTGLSSFLLRELHSSYVKRLLPPLGSSGAAHGPMPISLRTPVNAASTSMPGSQIGRLMIMNGIIM